jgi:hypothetical protein
VTVRTAGEAGAELGRLLQGAIRSLGGPGGQGGDGGAGGRGGNGGRGGFGATCSDAEGRLVSLPGGADGGGGSPGASGPGGAPGSTGAPGSVRIAFDR